MAMYGPRRLSLDAPARFPGDRSRIEGAPTSRARGAARSLAARDKASRPLTSSAPRHGGRAAESRPGSPVPSAGIEDLCERILVELRLQRGPASAVARERLIRLVSNYIGAHAQLFVKSADSGIEEAVNADETTGLGASALAQDLYAEISGLQVQLAEAQARTAEERSKLARANLKMRQAEENTRVAEERCFRAESRAHRAEARMRGADVPEFELKFTDTSGVATEDESRDMDLTKSRSQMPEQKSRSPPRQGRRPPAPWEEEQESRESPQKSSARFLQAKAKSKAASKPSERALARQAAAIKIQSIYRGNTDRQAAKEFRETREAAAVKLQSHHRGVQGRQVARQVREERRESEERREASVPVVPELPPLESQVATHVHFKFENLDYDKVMSSGELADDVKRKIGEAIAYNVKVSPTSVDVQLSPGSVVVNAQIYCISADAADLINNQISASGDSFMQSVDKFVSQIPDINSALAPGRMGLGVGGLKTSGEAIVEEEVEDDSMMTCKLCGGQGKVPKKAEVVESDSSGTPRLDLEEDLRQSKEAQLKEEADRLERLRKSLAMKRESMQKSDTSREEEKRRYEQQMAEMKRKEAEEKAKLERQLKEEREAREAAEKEAKKDIKKKYKEDMKKQQEEFKRLREREEEEKRLQKEKHDLELQKIQAAEQKERERLEQKYKDDEEKAEQEKKQLQAEMEALEREAKRKAQMEKKLKEELEEQNAKAAELQKQLEEERKRLEEEKKIREEMAQLESERFELHNKQRIEAIKAENAKQLEALQSQTKERSEETANMLAEQKRRELFQMLKLMAFNALQEFAEVCRREKKDAEMEKQIQELQKSFQEKEEFAANRMADKYYQKICEHLMKEALYIWKDAWFSKKNRKREEKFQKELEEMRTAERAKGGLQSEKMADKMQEKKMHQLKNRIFVDWSTIIIAEMAARKNDEIQQQLEALQQEQREKGDQTSELIADQAYKTYCLKLIQQCWKVWHQERIMAAATKKQAELERQLEENAFRERQRGDAAAEKAADKFAKQKLDELLRFIWKEWTEDFHHGKYERVKRKQEEELEKLKNERNAFAADKEADAEIMAEKFHKKICEEIKHICLGNWHKLAHHEKMERDAQKAKEGYQNEIAELQKKQREKGDATAETIADRHNKKRIQGWATRCLGKWGLEVRDQQAERQQLKAKLEYEEQMAKLKAAEREKGDKTAQAMAENFRKKLERQMLAEVVSIWDKEMVQVRADKVRDEEKRKMKEDMDKLLAQERGKGDAKAEQIAEQNVKRINYDLKIFTFTAWSQDTKDMKANRQQQQVEKELNDLKTKTRQKADTTANMMAEKFHKKICLQLLQACMTPWSKLGMQTAHEREKQRQKQQQEKEIAELKMKEREKGDKTAREMADKFYKKHWDAVLAQCLAAWFQDTKQVIAEKQSKKLQQEYEDQMAQMKAKERQKGDENAEMMSQQYFKRIQDDMKRVTLQLIREFVLGERAEREKFELEAKFEDDMKKLKEQEQANKDEQAAQMAERLHKKHQQAMLLRCVGGWQKEAMHGAAERQAAKERANFDEEIERLKQMEREKGDVTAERIADQRAKKLRHELATIVLYQWNKIADHGRSEREKKYFMQQHEKQMQELMALHAEQADVGGQIAQQMADSHKRLGDQAVMHQILAMWHHYTANETAIKKRQVLEQEYEDQMQQLKDKHRRRGDETAVKMADNFWRKHWNDRIRRCLTTWRTAQLRAVANRNEAEVRRAMQGELDKLKREARDAGGEKAEHMAKQFDKQHCVHILLTTLQLWCSFVSEEQFRQLERQMKLEHEQQLAAEARRAQGHATLTAEFIYRAKMRVAQARCLVHWAKWVRNTTTDLDNQNHVKMLKDKYEEREVQKLQASKEKIAELRAKMMDRFVATEELLTKTRFFCAFSFSAENNIRERYMTQGTLRQEDELARLVQVQAGVRFRMLSYMGGRMLRHINKLVKQRVMVEWMYVLRLYDKVKQHVAETMVVRHEMDEVLARHADKAEHLLDKMEAVVVPQRNRRVVKHALLEWHLTVSVGLTAMKVEEERVKSRHDFEVHKEKLMDDTAAMIGRLKVQVEDAKMQLLLQRVLWSWAEMVERDHLLGMQKADLNKIRDEYQEHLKQLEIEKLRMKDNLVEWNAEAVGKSIRQVGMLMLFNGWVRSTMWFNAREKSIEHSDQTQKMRVSHKKELAELTIRLREEKVAIGQWFVEKMDMVHDSALRNRLYMWWRSFSLMHPTQHQAVVKVEHKEMRSRGAEASLWMCEMMREQADRAEMDATLVRWLKAILEAWATKELKKVNKHMESEIYRIRVKQEAISHDQQLKLAGYINYRTVKDLMIRMIYVWKGGAEVQRVQSKLEISLVNFRVGVREQGRDVGLFVSDRYADMIEDSLLTVILSAWLTVTHQSNEAEQQVDKKEEMIERLQVDIQELTDELNHYASKSGFACEVAEKCIDLFCEAKVVIQVTSCWRSWHSSYVSSKREKTRSKAVMQTEQRMQEHIEEMERLQNKARLENVDNAAVLIRRTKLKLYFIRTIGAWQRFISRAKSDAEISKLKVEAQGEHSVMKEKLDKELEAVRSRSVTARELLVQKLGDAQENLLMTNVYRCWQRQWIIAEMDGEQRAVVSSLEKQLADAVRAKKAAESKANMTGALFSAEFSSAKGAKASAAKAKAEAASAVQHEKASKDKMKAEKDKMLKMMPSVKEELEAETPEQFMAIRKQRITKTMMKLVKRRLAIAMLGLMEFAGHRSENPEGFDESFAYAREQAKKRKATAQQEKMIAEGSLKEALEREKEALKKVDILEEENQERERQLTILRKELSAAREKLKMTARGDVATWNPAKAPPARGDDSADRDTSPDPTGKAKPLQSGQAAPPPKSSIPQAAGPGESALAHPRKSAPAPPAPTRPTGKSDSSKRVSFGVEKPPSGSGAGRGGGGGSADAWDGGVGATLDRLARARQAISGPSIDTDDDDFSWPAGTNAMPPPIRSLSGLDLGGPLGAASSPMPRAPRATVAEQAQLAAQLSELQLYMGRFEASHK